MPQTTTGALFAEAITGAVDSMSPYEARPELVFSDRPLPMSKVVEPLPELNRWAVLEDPLNWWGLANECLLEMEWSGMGASTVGIEAIQLPDGRYAFFEFGALDLHDELAEPSEAGPKLIAATAAGAGPGAKDAFLDELFRTNGEVFGIALMSSLPASLSIAFSPDRAVLVDAFVECLEAAAQWGMEPLEMLEEHDVVREATDGDSVLKASVAAYLSKMLGSE